VVAKKSLVEAAWEPPAGALVFPPSKPPVFDSSSS
jgi:hypothetical protein